MAVEKISFSVAPEVAELIRAQAAAAGVPVSVWLSRAATEKAAAATATSEAACAAAELLAGVEAEQGVATPAEHEWVAQVLASAGVVARAAG